MFVIVILYLFFLASEDDDDAHVLPSGTDLLKKKSMPEDKKLDDVSGEKGHNCLRVAAE